MDYWNSPKYKPRTKICEDAWDIFLHTAKILHMMDKKMSAKEKAACNWREPDIYSVFNKLRQDLHDELPYNPKFVGPMDEQIEREYNRERRAGKYLSPISEGIK